MESTAKHRRIWTHFQNSRPETFADAHPRCDFLPRWIHHQCVTKPHVVNIGIGDGHLERWARDAGYYIAAFDPDEQAVGRLKTEGLDSRVGMIEQRPLSSISGSRRLRGFITGTARIAFAKLGEQVTSPTICWVAVNMKQ